MCCILEDMVGFQNVVVLACVEGKAKGDFVLIKYVNNVPFLKSVLREDKFIYFYVYKKKKS